MKVAVLFTGLYRSFDITSESIITNLLEPNNAIPFIFCETSMSLLELKNKCPSNSRVKCYNGRPKEFCELYTKLINTKPAIQPNKFSRVPFNQSYLWNSGSIIEYYDYMKCYDMMLEYEKEHNMTFDIIIRTRLDIMFVQPLPILSFFTKIHSDMREITPEYIMNLGNQTMIKNSRGNPHHYGHVCRLEAKDFSDEKEVLEYINTENFIWTLGPNQVWIGKRHVMKKLHKMVYAYGDFDIGSKETFNSETQFTQFCKSNNIQHFMYCSHIDSKYSPYWSDTRYNRSLLGGEAPPDDLLFAIIR